MSLTPSLTVFSLFAVGLFGCMMAVFSWQRHHLGSWAKSFTALLIFAAIWSFGYGFEIGVQTLELKILWAKVQYIGIVYAPLAWMAFARRYTGRIQRFSGTGRTSRLWLMILAIVPTLTLLLVITNESHLLIWQSTGVNPNSFYSTLEVDYGSWFWVHSAYSYLLMLAGTVMLCIAYFRFDAAFRWQSGILLLGAVTPWLANIFFISGYSPFPGLDLSPFGFGITGILLTIGVFWVKLFDLVPVARRLAVENMEDGIVILDVNGQIVDMNRSSETIIGRSLLDLIGQPFIDVEAIDTVLIELVQGEAPAAGEIKMIRNGGTLSYAVRISPIWNDREVESGRLLSFRDITEQAQARLALAKRTQLLETLNSLSSDITSSLDLQSILSTVVESAANLLEITSVYINEYNYDAQTVQVIAEYFSPEASHLERVSDLGVIYDAKDEFGVQSDWMEGPFTKYVLQIDDPEISAESRAHLAKFGCKTSVEVPLYVEDQLIGTLELWESRHKREFTDDDLELILAIAQQAAVALHNAQLYKQALAASELKSRLLTQVNHELRTPLSVILLYSEMLEGGIFGELTEQQANSIDKVVASTNYLHSLVEKLLAQAEFENGKVELRNDSFEPAEIVALALKQLSILAESKSLALVGKISPTFPRFIYGDQDKIKQIVLNLVSNAIKYTQEGGVDFSVYAADDDHWVIKVTDTGMGIPLEDQASIFEPFWQTSGVKMKLSRNGTGLGLSIVDQLVHLMGGKVELDSIVGRGSTFTVTLPLKIALEKVY